MIFMRLPSFSGCEQNRLLIHSKCNLIRPLVTYAARVCVDCHLIGLKPCDNNTYWLSDVRGCLQSTKFSGFYISQVISYSELCLRRGSAGEAVLGLRNIKHRDVTQRLRCGPIIISIVPHPFNTLSVPPSLALWFMLPFFASWDLRSS